MDKAIVYDQTTGLIIKRLDMPRSMHKLQCLEGEELFTGECPADATHIKNGRPVKITEAAPAINPEQRMRQIRLRRNQLLSSCDWRIMPDSPLSPEKIEEWRVYRQALRDFTDICDIDNPVWPVAPA